MNSIVIKNRNTIGCEPGVSLQTIGTQLQSQLKCLQCVLWRVRFGPTMSERDGYVSK
jgi:hypothetical protein